MSAQLPPRQFGPWAEQKSSVGRVYYYNKKSEISQWDKPRDWLEYERIHGEIIGGPPELSNKVPTERRRSGERSKGGVNEKPRFAPPSIPPPPQGPPPGPPLQHPPPIPYMGAPPPGHYLQYPPPVLPPGIPPGIPPGMQHYYNQPPPQHAQYYQMSPVPPPPPPRVGPPPPPFFRMAASPFQAPLAHAIPPPPARPSPASSSHAIPPPPPPLQRTPRTPGNPMFTSPRDGTYHGGSSSSSGIPPPPPPLESAPGRSSRSTSSSIPVSPRTPSAPGRQREMMQHQQQQQQQIHQMQRSGSVSSRRSQMSPPARESSSRRRYPQDEQPQPIQQQPHGTPSSSRQSRADRLSLEGRASPEPSTPGAASSSSANAAAATPIERKGSPTLMERMHKVKWPIPDMLKYFDEDMAMEVEKEMKLDDYENRRNLSITRHHADKLANSAVCKQFVGTLARYTRHANDHQIQLLDLRIDTLTTLIESLQQRLQNPQPVESLFAEKPAEQKPEIDKFFDEKEQDENDASSAADHHADRINFHS